MVAHQAETLESRGVLPRSRGAGAGSRCTPPPGLPVRNAHNGQQRAPQAVAEGGPGVVSPPARRPLHAPDPCLQGPQSLHRPHPRRLPAPPRRPHALSGALPWLGAHPPSLVSSFDLDPVTHAPSLLEVWQTCSPPSHPAFRTSGLGEPRPCSGRTATALRSVLWALSPGCRGVSSLKGTSPARPGHCLPLPSNSSKRAIPGGLQNPQRPQRISKTQTQGCWETEVV